MFCHVARGCLRQLPPAGSALPGTLQHACRPAASLSKLYAAASTLQPAEMHTPLLPGASPGTRRACGPVVRLTQAPTSELQFRGKRAALLPGTACRCCRQLNQRLQRSAPAPALQHCCRQPAPARLCAAAACWELQQRRGRAARLQPRPARAAGARLSGHSEQPDALPAEALHPGGSGVEASEQQPQPQPQPVLTPLTPQLHEYLLAHTRQPPALARVWQETAEALPVGARMQVAPEQAAFLGWLVEALRVERAVEVGVFHGYSSLAIALALPEGGRLVACERDPRALEAAQCHWAAAGVAHKIETRLGAAKEALDALLAEGGAGSYDFAFIDADKRGYWEYYQQCLRLLRPGGVVAVDNVLWYGRPADPEAQDKQTLAIRDFNTRLLADERISLSILPVGDGMALCRKR